MQSNFSKALVVISICAVGLGCASTSSTSSTSSERRSEPAKLTDPQIAAIVVTANRIDIENGQLALSRSENDDVRGFAERMIEDHQSVNQSATELVTRLGVTPEESDTSRKLASDAKRTRERLSQLSGTEFDRAYVDNEVAYHEAVIGMLDSTLIPNAMNPELKSMLVGVRPAFVAHLEHARSIQRTLSGHSSSGHSH